ncbi:hypothetical protein D3C72_2041090 [compost metagenome]
MMSAMTILRVAPALLLSVLRFSSSQRLNERSQVWSMVRCGVLRLNRMSIAEPSAYHDHSDNTVQVQPMRPARCDASSRLRGISMASTYGMDTIARWYSTTLPLVSGSDS